METNQVFGENKHNSSSKNDMSLETAFSYGTVGNKTANFKTNKKDALQMISRDSSSENSSLSLDSEVKFNGFLHFEKISFSLKAKKSESSSDSQLKLLKNVSVTVKTGQILGVLGKSGSGKSTLLKVVSGIDPTEDGGEESELTGWIEVKMSMNGKQKGVALEEEENEVYFNSKTIYGKKPSLLNLGLCSFCPQNFSDLLEECLTCEETLEYACSIRNPNLEELEKEKLVQDVIMNLDLQKVKHLPVSKLSGGEKKRIAIATCCLFSSSPIIIMDEPTSGLSANDALNLMRFIKNIFQKYQLIVLLSIHQPRFEILELFDHKIYLNKGSISKEELSEIQEPPETTETNTLDQCLTESEQSKKRKSLERENLHSFGLMRRSVTQNHQTFMDNIFSMIPLLVFFFRVLKRDKSMVLLPCLQMFVFSLMWALVFMNSGKSTDHIDDYVRVIYRALLSCMMAIQGVCLHQLSVLTKIRFEVSLGWYPKWILFPVLGILGLGISFLYSFINWVPLWLLTSLDEYPFLSFLVTAMYIFAWFSYAQLCLIIGNKLMAIVFAVWFLFTFVARLGSGVYINSKHLPEVWQWFKYVNIDYQVVTLLLNFQVKDTTFFCPENAVGIVGCPEFPGTLVIQSLGLENSSLRNYFVILGNGIFALVMAYFVFKRNSAKLTIGGPDGQKFSEEDKYNASEKNVKEFSIEMPEKENKENMEEEEETKRENGKIDVKEGPQKDHELKEEQNSNIDHSDNSDIIHLFVENLSIEIKKSTFKQNESSATPTALGDGMESKFILKKVSLWAKKSQLIGIVGPSGSGKSSLLHAIGGSVLDNNLCASADNFLFRGENVLKSLLDMNLVSIVEQGDSLLRGHLNVKEALEMIASFQPHLPSDMSEREVIIEDLAKCLDLFELLQLQVSNLSGGQMRRLSLAISCLYSSPILLGDEVTTGLSSKETSEIVSVLRRLCKKEKKIIMITIHQANSDVWNMFDKVLVLRDGISLYFGSPINLENMLTSKTSSMDKSLFSKNGVRTIGRSNSADVLMDIISVNSNNKNKNKENTDHTNRTSSGMMLKEEEKMDYDDIFDGNIINIMTKQHLEDVIKIKSHFRKAIHSNDDESNKNVELEKGPNNSSNINNIRINDETGNRSFSSQCIRILKEGAALTLCDWREQIRSPGSSLGVLGQGIFLSLMVSWLMSSIPIHASASQGILGGTTIIIFVVRTHGISWVLQYHSQRYEKVKKEVAFNRYSFFSYWIYSMSRNMFRYSLGALLSAFPYFLMVFVEHERNFGTYLELALIFLLIQLMEDSIGSLCVFSMDSPTVGQTLYVVVGVYIMVFAGFDFKYNHMSQFTRILALINPGRFSYNALSYLQFKNQEFPCATNGDINYKACPISGIDTLYLEGQQPHYYHSFLWLMFVAFIVCHFICAVLLKLRTLRSRPTIHITSGIDN